MVHKVEKKSYLNHTSISHSYPLCSQVIMKVFLMPFHPWGLEVHPNNPIDLNCAFSFTCVTSVFTLHLGLPKLEEVTFLFFTDPRNEFS